MHRRLLFFIVKQRRMLGMHDLFSSAFYASREGSPTGPVVDQAEIDQTLSNPVFQDNANQAVHRFAA